MGDPVGGNGDCDQESEKAVAGSDSEVTLFDSQELPSDETHFDYDEEDLSNEIDTRYSTKEALTEKLLDIFPTNRVWQGFVEEAKFSSEQCQAILSSHENLKSSTLTTSEFFTAVYKVYNVLDENDEQSNVFKKYYPYDFTWIQCCEAIQPTEFQLNEINEYIRHREKTKCSFFFLYRRVFDILTADQRHQFSEYYQDLAKLFQFEINCNFLDSKREALWTLYSRAPDLDFSGLINNIYSRQSFLFADQKLELHKLFGLYINKTNEVDGLNVLEDRKSTPRKAAEIANQNITSPKTERKEAFEKEKTNKKNKTNKRKIQYDCNPLVKKALEKACDNPSNNSMRSIEGNNTAKWKTLRTGGNDESYLVYTLTIPPHESCSEEDKCEEFGEDVINYIKSYRNLQKKTTDSNMLLITGARKKNPFGEWNKRSSKSCNGLGTYYVVDPTNEKIGTVVVFHSTVRTLIETISEKRGTLEKAAPEQFEKNKRIFIDLTQDDSATGSDIEDEFTFEGGAVSHPSMNGRFANPSQNASFLEKLQSPGLSPQNGPANSVNQQPNPLQNSSMTYNTGNPSAFFYPEQNNHVLSMRSEDKGEEEGLEKRLERMRGEGKRVERDAKNINKKIDESDLEKQLVQARQNLKLEQEELQKSKEVLASLTDNTP